LRSRSDERGGAPEVKVGGWRNSEERRAQIAQWQEQDDKK
jgi:hypothetical protein